MCSTTRRGTASPGRLSSMHAQRCDAFHVIFVQPARRATETHALADWLLQLKARKHCYFHTPETAATSAEQKLHAHTPPMPAVLATSHGQKCLALFATAQLMPMSHSTTASI